MRQACTAWERHPLIFVVDVDEAVRHSLRFSLEAEGFTVKEDATGGQLLLEPEIGAASCLVIDNGLPDMTGLEALRQIRDRGIDVPAIIITARLSETMRAGAAAAGARVAEKPFLGTALMNDIHSLCGV